MLGFSFTEIILLAIIALVVIGPKQLPEVARNLGRFLNELKRTSNAFTREFRENMDKAKIDPIRFDEPKFHDAKLADASTVTPNTITTPSTDAHGSEAHGADVKVGMHETTEPLGPMPGHANHASTPDIAPIVTPATLSPETATTPPAQVYTHETHTRSSYYRPDAAVTPTTPQVTPLFPLEPSQLEVADNKAFKKEDDSHD